MRPNSQESEKPLDSLHVSEEKLKQYEYLNSSIGIER